MANYSTKFTYGTGIKAGQSGLSRTPYAGFISRQDITNAGGIEANRAAYFQSQDARNPVRLNPFDSQRPNARTIAFLTGNLNSGRHAKAFKELGAVSRGGVFQNWDNVGGNTSGGIENDGFSRIEGYRQSYSGNVGDKPIGGHLPKQVGAFGIGGFTSTRPNAAARSTPSNYGFFNPDLPQIPVNNAYQPTNYSPAMFTPKGAEQIANVTRGGTIVNNSNSIGNVRDNYARGRYWTSYDYNQSYNKRDVNGNDVLQRTVEKRNTPIYVDFEDNYFTGKYEPQYIGAFNLGNNIGIGTGFAAQAAAAQNKV